MPDDLSDRHVPHCVQEGLSQRTAAPMSLRSLFFSRPPPRHRGERRVRERETVDTITFLFNVFHLHSQCPLVL